MRTLTLYTRPGCHLCEQALLVLDKVQADVRFQLVERDISAEQELHSAYFDRIPVVDLDGEELFEHFVDEEALRDALAAPAR